MQRGTYLPIIDCEEGIYMNKKGQFLYFDSFKGGQIYLRKISRWGFTDPYEYDHALNVLKTSRSLMIIGVNDAL